MQSEQLPTEPFIYYIHVQLSTVTSSQGNQHHAFDKISFNPPPDGTSTVITVTLPSLTVTSGPTVTGTIG